MVNSHLTPVARADKNGKVVTRHIKGDHTTRSPAITLPHPQLAASAQGRLMNGDDFRAKYPDVDNPLIDLLPDGYRERLSDLLEDEDNHYGSKFLPRFIGDVVEGNEAFVAVAIDFTGYIYGKSRIEDADRDEDQDYRRYVWQLENVQRHLPDYNVMPSRLFIQTRKRDMFGAEVNSVMNWSDEEMLWDEDKPFHTWYPVMDPYMERATPLVVMFCKGKSENPSDEEIASVARFAEKHRGRINEVYAILRERDSYDETLIEEILSQQTGALRDGVL